MLIRYIIVNEKENKVIGSTDISYPLHDHPAEAAKAFFAKELEDENVKLYIKVGKQD